MLSNIIWYLMIGVVLAGFYDSAASKMESENQFNNKERVLVVLIWPIAAFMFVWAFIKTLIDNDSN